LTALLSHALVAYTVELDNEFEHRMPHRTQNHGLSPGAPADFPWLTSVVMWETCVRHVPPDGITVADLRRAARAGTNLDGMRRWGYATLTSPSGVVAARSGRAYAHPKITDRTVVRLTDWGRRAHATWSELDQEIEDRWRSRLGAGTLTTLRSALAVIANGIGPSLPDCLPITAHGMFSRPEAGVPATVPSGLRALLSRVLLGFAVEYEADSGVSLAIGADILRVLSAEGVRPRDIAARSGVSKEAVAMALTWLKSVGLAEESPDPAARRGKVVRLTARGAGARAVRRTDRRRRGCLAGPVRCWRRYRAAAGPGGNLGPPRGRPHALPGGVAADGVAPIRSAGLSHDFAPGWLPGRGLTARTPCHRAALRAEFSRD
jgi:DNA-binding MarR family transcriptional regulator